MGVTFRAIEVETGSMDREGVLVFEAERLIAILVRLSDLHEDAAGTWHLEYGPSFRKRPAPFNSLDQAVTWIETVGRG